MQYFQATFTHSTSPPHPCHPPAGPTGESVLPDPPPESGEQLVSTAVRELRDRAESQAPRGSGEPDKLKKGPKTVVK